MDSQSKLLKRILLMLVSFIYLLSVKPFLFMARWIAGINRIFYLVIYYHSVPDSSIRRFKNQLSLIIKLAHPIPIWFTANSAKRNRNIIITFDDGFRSVIKNAVPLLLQREVPFTIFIPSGNLGNKPYWLNNTDHKDKHDSIVSAQEILALPTEIVTIGSHTINHYRLSTLNMSAALEEINWSKKQLEILTQTTIKFIALPYGDYCQDTIELCKKSGYEQVFTIQQESPFSPHNNYVKGRTAVDPSDWYFEFILKILGAYEWRISLTSMNQGAYRRISSLLKR